MPNLRPRGTNRVVNVPSGMAASTRGRRRRAEPETDPSFRSPSRLRRRQMNNTIVIDDSLEEIEDNDESIILNEDDTEDDLDALSDVYNSNEDSFDNEVDEISSIEENDDNTTDTSGESITSTDIDESSNGENETDSMSSFLDDDSDRDSSTPTSSFDENWGPGSPLIISLMNHLHNQAGDDYDRNEYEPVDDVDFTVPSAKELNESLIRSSEHGDCPICFDDVSVDPVGCIYCRKFVGCRQCIQRWVSSAKAKKAEDSGANCTNHYACPLCRHEWGEIPEVESIFLIEFQ